MTEDQKKEVAVFRFSIIHDFVNGIKLEYGEQEKLIQKKCDRKWVVPFSDKTSICRSTILRWIRLYKESGAKLESLYPQDRSDCGCIRAMDEETCLSLISIREELPKVTVPLLMRTMKQRRLVSPSVNFNSSTVYRFLHQEGLMKKNANPVDRRKYEAELSNEIWQSDVMHGPKLKIGNKHKKTYLIAFIDDHSRLIPHGEFYPAENVACFLKAFEKALLKRGLPRKLYVDNGAAYRSKHLAYTTAALGISLIHAKPYKPQGKGKIERFFKTVRSQLLSVFKGETLYEINEAFTDWLANTYHQRKHTSTGQTPFKRFTAGMECVRSAPEELKDYFRKTVLRRVNKDRTITVENRLYEAPVALIGKKVEILYHENKREEIEVRWLQKSFGQLHQVNLHANCRVKRDKNCQVEISGQDVTPETGQIWED